MGVIFKEIEIAGSKGRAIVKALFDSGATLSFVKKDVAEKIATLEKLPTKHIFKTADKNNSIVAEYRISADFYIDGLTFSDEFIVLDHLSESLIIGAKTMQGWDIKLDLKNHKLILNPDATKLQII